MCQVSGSGAAVPVQVVRCLRRATFYSVPARAANIQCLGPSIGDQVGQPMHASPVQRSLQGVIATPAYAPVEGSLLSYIRKWSARRYRTRPGRQSCIRKRTHVKPSAMGTHIIQGQYTSGPQLLLDPEVPIV